MQSIAISYGEVQSGWSVQTSTVVFYGRGVFLLRNLAKLRITSARPFPRERRFCNAMQNREKSLGSIRNPLLYPPELWAQTVDARLWKWRGAFLGSSGKKFSLQVLPRTSAIDSSNRSGSGADAYPGSFFPLSDLNLQIKSPGEGNHMYYPIQLSDTIPTIRTSITGGRVAVAGSVTTERISTGGRVEIAGRTTSEC